MADPRPIPEREPGQPTSGRELQLQVRGTIQRLRNGVEVVDDILVETLKSLQDVDGTFARKSPASLAFARLQFARLLQDGEQHRERIDVALRKLELERRKVELAERIASQDDDDYELAERDAFVVTHTPDCALRHGGDACDCMGDAEDEPDPDPDEGT